MVYTLVSVDQLIMVILDERIIPTTTILLKELAIILWEFGFRSSSTSASSLWGYVQQIKS